MSDLELANDWLSRTFKDTPLHPQVYVDLEALLGRVRLDEAKIWRDNTYSINMESNEWRIKRLAALEQAAGVGKK